MRIANFKRFRDETFELAETTVLAGPNDAGKSTVLQAIATWKLLLDRWVAARESGERIGRSGVRILRSDLASVPVREMNLLWEDRRVVGARGAAGARRPIEIEIDGESGAASWSCGIELRYANPEQAYLRPKDAGRLGLDAIRRFPPDEADALAVVFVPPLSGIERDEPRREQGMQDLLVGQGRAGEILRNLLWEVASAGDAPRWERLAKHMQDLFRIELIRPVYSPSRPHIHCEYRDPACTRPLDLASAGSGSLQTLLLFAFLYARPAAVLLLDEPDAHQHPVLQRKVYDLLREAARERGGQLIVATHSEAVLDATAPERTLRLVRPARRALA